MILKRMASQKRRNTGDQKDNNGDKSNSSPSGAEVRKISQTADENLNFIESFFGSGFNFIKRKIDMGNGKKSIALICIESLTNTDNLYKAIIVPLLENKMDSGLNPDDTQVLVSTKYISLPEISSTDRMEQVLDRLLNGDVAIFIDQLKRAIIVGNRKLEKRAIEKPENESTVLGSQESFTDNLETNISMIIKRLPHPNLRFEAFTVGRLSQTQIRLVWLEGIANPDIITEVKNRIKSINIDIVGGIGTLSELIEDSPLSIFPKYKQTERPDFTALYLVNGHFAIISNNSPYAFLAPVSFWDNFKTMDDYDDKVISGNYLRFVRYGGFLISILISPLYLSFVTYNHAIVPSTLAYTIAAGRHDVPFPSVVETLLMTFAMSIIREAGVRMPGAVGYFIGTLAAVLIGQQIVSAGYISASLVIVIAVSVIASFAISTSTLVYTSRLLNYFLILLSGFFGMFGLINGIAVILWHLCSLESFGMPYLYPVVPFEKTGMDDTVIRTQFSRLVNRLPILAPFNRRKLDVRYDSSKHKNHRGADK